VETTLLPILWETWNANQAEKSHLKIKKSTDISGSCLALRKIPKDFHKKILSDIAWEIRA